MSKKTLIIPDIHLRVEQAEEIIRHVKADEVIFLGDYFDDFGDNIDMIREACIWLEYSVKQPNRIHLFGNHDIHYAYADQRFQCSGFEDWKYWVIQDNLDGKVWSKLKFYHFLNNKFLLTHAGLHKLHVPKEILALHDNRKNFYAAIDAFLQEEITKGFRDRTWIFHAGFGRGGYLRAGGILWCDYEREFHPIRGLNQIFGHTPQVWGFPKWCVWNKGSDQVNFLASGKYSPNVGFFNDTKKSYNLCLDVHKNTHWIVWDGKSFTINNYRDNM